MTAIQPTNGQDGGHPGHTIDISAHISRSITVSTNLEQDVIVTTRDKISNALHDVLPKYRRRVAWLGPAGITLSLWIALASTDFNQKLLGVPADTWKGAFMFAAAAGTIWVLVSVLRAIFSGATHNEVLKAITSTRTNSGAQTIQGTVEPENSH